MSVSCLETDFNELSFWEITSREEGLNALKNNELINYNFQKK